MKSSINKKLLFAQVLAILLIAMTFIITNVCLYNLFTKYFINHYSYEMREKSIEINKYLPFDENSLIVKVDSDIKINENIPKIDGATALFPVYSAIVNAIYPSDSIEYDGNKFGVNSKIDKTGTGNAFKKVIDSDVDIIFCAEPSKEQLNYAKKIGVDLELVPIGKDAFVFIVNSKNEVDDLTVNQIKDIYTGKINNWKDLGGEDKNIIPLRRKQGSGSETAMVSFMGGIEMKHKLTMPIGRRIGYSFRYYIENVLNDGNIKILSLNGIYPSKENIRNDAYPISGYFYMIYRKDNDNKNIDIIKNYILSREGQDIIDETGYVSINSFNN